MTEKAFGKMPDLSGKQISMFCDFDGTISIGDVTDILLEQLANPNWHIIEERWQAGELDDYECMAQQISLINGNWQDIVSVLEKIKLDENFKLFTHLCRQAKIPVFIGSSGIDKIIDYFFNREKIEVNHIWAYQLIASGKGWSLQYPPEPPRTNCQFSKSITCKCSTLQSHKLINKDKANTYNIVIGDGRSDFCWVHSADFVFAKPKLAQYCKEKNISHASFANFADINEYCQQIIFSQA